MRLFNTSGFEISTANRAAQVYELVDNRMILLRHPTNRIERGFNLDGIGVDSYCLSTEFSPAVSRCTVRLDVLREAKSQLPKTGMSPRGKFAK